MDAGIRAIPPLMSPDSKNAYYLNKNESLIEGYSTNKCSSCSAGVCTVKRARRLAVMLCFYIRMPNK